MKILSGPLTFLHKIVLGLIVPYLYTVQNLYDSVKMHVRMNVQWILIYYFIKFIMATYSRRLWAAYSFNCIKCNREFQPSQMDVESRNQVKRHIYPPFSCRAGAHWTHLCAKNEISAVSFF